MDVNTKFGQFTILKDFKDAYNSELFEERYLEEIYDKYNYIVGDYSASILRLKGFSNKNHVKIPDYLNESCVYKCPYFILKRITKDGVNKNERFANNNRNKKNSKKD